MKWITTFRRFFWHTAQEKYDDGKKYAEGEIALYNPVEAAKRVEENCAFSDHPFDRGAMAVITHMEQQYKAGYDTAMTILNQAPYKVAVDVITRKSGSNSGNFQRGSLTALEDFKKEHGL